MRQMLLTCGVLLVFVGLVFGQASDLFFSEYVEGSSNNKALEIYNGTGSSVDLGAGNYTIEFYFNGNTTPGYTLNLVGVVPDGDVFVVAHSSADPVILAVADQTAGGSWYNGDDAVVLLKNGVVIDVIGQVGFDPGSEWGSGDTSTRDNTLRRKVAVCQGDTDPSDPFDPALEWDGYPKDTFDGLGTHTASCLADATPPSCELTAVHPGPPLSIEITIQDGESGLQAVNVVQIQNATVNIPAFSPGTTSPVIVTAAKIDNSKSAFLALEVVDVAGNAQICDPVYTTLSSIAPETFELKQNYPNPFNPSTTIEFYLPSTQAGTEMVSLKVFDLMGREVRTLIKEPIAPGHYSVMWDGKDNAGREVAAGVYLYQLKFGTYLATRKMQLVK